MIHRGSQGLLKNFSLSILELHCGHSENEEGSLKKHPNNKRPGHTDLTQKAPTPELRPFVDRMGKLPHVGHPCQGKNELKPDVDTSVAAPQCFSFRDRKGWISKRASQAPTPALSLLVINLLYLHSTGKVVGFNETNSMTPQLEVPVPTTLHPQEQRDNEGCHGQDQRTGRWLRERHR